MVLITIELGKDKVWQEIVRRTRHNDGDFEDSEVKVIRHLFGDRLMGSGRNRKAVKVTEPGGRVRRFKDIEKCAKYYGAVYSQVQGAVWRGNVQRRGIFKGYRFEYD